MTRLLACSLLVLVASCSDYKDVIVTNPCSHPVTVRLLNSDGRQLGAASAYVVPSASAKRLENVLPNVGSDSYLADVMSGTKRVDRIVVPDTKDPVPVVVRAAACG